MRATRLRLRRWGIELVVETEGTPTFDTPPVVELSRQGQVSMTRRPGVRRLTLRLAPGAHLGRGLVLELRPEGDHLLEMDNDAYFLSAARLVLLDGEISLGRATRVRDGAVIRCSGRLTTGALSGINNYAIVHCANRVRLGEGSHITDRVTVVDSDHAHDGSDEWHMLQPTLIGEVEIGDNTLVGANAVILRDARVGANSIVAAGSVVVGGDYPDSSLLAGVPATVVRELRTEDQPA